MPICLGPVIPPTKKLARLSSLPTQASEVVIAQPALGSQLGCRVSSVLSAPGLGCSGPFSAAPPGLAAAASPQLGRSGVRPSLLAPGLQGVVQDPPNIPGDSDSMARPAYHSILVLIMGLPCFGEFGVFGPSSQSPGFDVALKVTRRESVDLASSLVDVGLQDNASLATGMAFEAPALAVALAGGLCRAALQQ
ncbi:hypothetical protein OIU78_025012 [Salix suchowensis]|nr:hypothetical protein OIU78_025012 [Salix suchowensis]